VEALNYHHLFYFWMVAREGSITAASRRLHVAQPTISAQIRSLEKDLGAELFDRSGRRLKLSETGRQALGYAEDIFSLGQELVEAMQSGELGGRGHRLRVGLALVVPKLIAYRLLEPALRENIQIECVEDRLEGLVPRLVNHEVDMIISDAPLSGHTSVRAFNHPLGRSNVTFFGARELAKRHRAGFPASLDGAPFILPLGGALRGALDAWFERKGVRPSIVGRFDDSALTKVFGEAGAGLFAGPSVIEADIRRQYGVEVVGRTDELHDQFYVISVERRLKHSGVVAITNSARESLFK
jgi:LysR family transcriptional activator of nhaA